MADPTNDPKPPEPARGPEPAPAPGKPGKGPKAPPPADPKPPEPARGPEQAPAPALLKWLVRHRDDVREVEAADEAEAVRVGQASWGIVSTPYPITARPAPPAE